MNSEEGKKNSTKKGKKDMPITMEQKPIEIEGKVKVSSKGQIVIPIEVRRAAGINDSGQEIKYHYKDGKVILEIEEYISPEDLLGFFDNEDDSGDFVLDLNQAREERAEEILRKGL